MAASWAVFAIVTADVLPTDVVTCNHERNAEPTSPAFLGNKTNEADEDAMDLRLLPHLLALSNVGLALRLNSQLIWCLCFESSPSFFTLFCRFCVLKLASSGHLHDAEGP
jgi:hypothetical protein